MQQNIEKHLGDKIKVSRGKKNILFSSSMTVDEAIRVHSSLDKITQENKVREVAYHSRKSIFGSVNTVLSTNLTQ